jgi:hypothetical protein
VLDPPNHSLQWNSGYEVKARIGEMRIPLDKIDKRKPQAGQDLRVNSSASRGSRPMVDASPGSRQYADGFHVPEAFGLLRFEILIKLFK